MSRPARRRPDPALLRARYRTLFFLCFTLLAAALGDRAAVAPAMAGVLLSVYSIRVASTRPDELAHTFVVLDWACLGIALAVTGGAGGWLLAAVPFLAFGQVAGAPREHWPFLVGPSLLLPVILAIADPTLGGSRGGALVRIALLVAGGCVAATRVRRRPAQRRRREAHVAKVDPGTGLWTAVRLPGFLEQAAASALEQHQPCSVVYLRLEHFGDSRDFLGVQDSEALARGVARRAELHAGRDGRAFRVCPDGIVLVLPGLSLAEAREVAASLSREVSGTLIAGRRQTLATGAASFPTLRDIEDVLAAARAEALPDAPLPVAVGETLPLAATR